MFIIITTQGNIDSAAWDLLVKFRLFRSTKYENNNIFVKLTPLFEIKAIHSYLNKLKNRAQYIFKSFY